MKNRLEKVKFSFNRANFYTVLFAFLLVGMGACKQNNTETDPKEVATDQNDQKFEDKSEDDAAFAVDAAVINMAEIKLGELAQKQGKSADVKSLGKMMVDEHTKALDELKTLAQSKQITLPADVDDKHRSKYDDLSKKTGTDFDKAYADEMVSGHKDAIDKFKTQSENGKDADLRAMATKMLPNLQTHLDHSQMVKDKVDK